MEGACVVTGDGGSEHVGVELPSLLRIADNVLQSCYDSWLDEDSSLSEMYEFSIDETLENMMEAYKENKLKLRESR